MSSLTVCTVVGTDFRTVLLAAYLDLRKVFDSVNRDVLWEIQALRRIPPRARQPNIRLVFWYEECCEVCYHHLCLFIN